MKKYHKLLALSIFVLVSCLLGLLVSPLRLYLDDANLVFPVITRTYISHFFGYIGDNGFFRPLALIYYYFIYTVYLFSSALAHTIPLLITVLTSVLIYFLLKKQGIKQNFALLCSVLILAIPFWAEAYGWLSANPGAIVIFIFFFQVFLLEQFAASKKLFSLLFLLQVVASFLYESTFFMPIALGLLWLRKRAVEGGVFKSIKVLVSSSLFLFIPGFLYFLINQIFSSVNQTRLKPGNLLLISQNLSGQFTQLGKLLFNSEGNNFFIETGLLGFTTIISSPLSLALSVLLFLAFVLIILKNNDEANTSTDKKFSLIFWFSCFLLALIPLLVQKYYLPFRLIVFPLIFLVITLFFLLTVSLEKYKGIFIKGKFLFITKFLILFLTFWGIFVQAGMLTSYKNQYNLDLRVVKEISEKTVELGFLSNNRTNLYLQNFPDNFVSSFVYGDYLYTMFHYPWSTEAFIDLSSGTINKTATEFTNGNVFISNYKKEEFVKLRPLTIFTYTGNEQCQKSNCLELVGVFQK